MLQYETKRLTVGPITGKDREAMLDLLTDRTVGKTYMLPEYAAREDAFPMFRRLADLSLEEERYVSGIHMDGCLIGIINETDVNGGTIELGWAILPKHHNRGFATESVRGAVEYLLDNGFDEVMAGAFQENPASIRVMEKSGMKKLERQDEVEYRGKIHSCVYYSVRKEKEGMNGNNTNHKSIAEALD